MRPPLSLTTDVEQLVPLYLKRPERDRLDENRHVDLAGKARIEHDRTLDRIMTALLKDDTQLFKEFSDNSSFRRWLTDTVFGLTYRPGAAPPPPP